MNPNYEQDNIKLYNADCMDIMAQYDDDYFDLAIVDPPYRDPKNNAPTKQMREKKGGKMKNFGNKPGQEYFDELFRISKNQIIWGVNNFIEFLVNTNCVIVWDKCQPWENYSQVELAWTSFSKPCPLFKFDNRTKDKIHPTQKPVALYNWLYSKFAKEGQKILDTHLGSGSNAIAAHYFRMSEFVGCELDPEYFAAACQRIEIETRQLELGL